MSIETAELTIEQRVAAGAAWLDENKPGWVDAIDLGRLDVQRPCNCVLGQVFGHYNTSPREARWSSSEVFAAASRGFEADRHTLDYHLLTAEWRRLIESRRAEVE